MSSLESLTERYLETRRALGYELKFEHLHLPKLARFVVAHGAEYLRTTLVLEWAADTPSGSAGQFARRLSWARQLALYLSAYDPRTQIPPPDLAPRQGPRRPTPYIYRDGEVAALLDACARLGTLRAYTHATLIALMAVTGMRVGEVIALDRSDLDAERLRLTIRSGKFGKARRLPLSRSTGAALLEYARTRDGLLRTTPRSPALLLSLAGTRLLRENVLRQFRHLVDDAGVGATGSRPRPHDLRHSFAVETVRRWYAEDREIEPRLPVLSTWLGHVSPSSTYWYLTATPELLELARSRAERRAGYGT